MIEKRTGPDRVKVVGCACALLAIIAGGWSVVKFGPRPIGQNEQPKTTVSAQPSKPPDLKSVEPSTEMPSPQGFFDTFSPLSSNGFVAESCAEYLNKLEKIYKQRGYQSLTTILQHSRKARRDQWSKLTNVYWRIDAGSNGSGVISAKGANADPNTDEQNSKPIMYTTMVMPGSKGGAQWVTYHNDQPTDKAPYPADLKSLKSDLPGSDPPGVPRPPGLYRLFNFYDAGASGNSMITFYVSSEPSTSLMKWYLREMSPSWQIEPFATGQANSVTNGAICFTQGRRFCLVWVKPGKTEDQTLVIISLRN